MPSLFKCSPVQLKPPFILLTLASMLPLLSQAALPEPVQTALTRAALSPNDISIIISPVGAKNHSSLPPVLSVIHKQPVKIKQQVRQINAYTDDPYTHLSIEYAAPIVPSSKDAVAKTAPNNTANPAPKVLPPPKPLLSHQPNTPRMPASTMKLIPSFVALDTLGADFVWFTRVYHSGVIIGTRLHGDLIIQGSGDPKMTHERLQGLLLKVKQAGISHIEGDIIVDSAVFKAVSKNPAAFDNAPLRPYNASPDGFLVNFNTVAINSYPLTNGQAKLTYTPSLANYQLPSTIGTRTAKCSHARNSLAPQWQADALRLNAKLPSSCGEHVFYVGYPDAKDFAARVVKAQWQALGNTLSGTVSAQEQAYQPHSRYSLSKTKPNAAVLTGLALLPVAPLPIVSYPSLNLTQQIYDINHFSNNVMTEQVTLSIGAYRDLALSNKALPNKSQAKNPSKPSTIKANSLYQFATPSSDYPQALQSITQWWQTHLTTPPPHLTNGSGLCRECRLTAANVEELLTYAYQHPSFDAYVSSLGVAGVSGTILHHSERLPTSAAIGRAWIKTGTLNNVTAMAGYVKGQSGQDYTVVGLINTEQALNPDTARPVLDAMLDWTAQQ